MPAQIKEASLNILLIQIAMVFIGGVLGGFLPLLMKNCIVSDRLMNLISIFGAGIMLGVGLIIIIPEGTSLVYQSYELIAIENAEIICGVGIAGGFILMMVIDEIIGSYAYYQEKKLDKKLKQFAEFHRDLEQPFIPESCTTVAHSKQESLSSVDLKIIGVNYGHQSPNITQSTPSSPLVAHTRKKDKQMVAVQITTVGLAIHCFSDGLALGISELSGQSTGALVFLAVILHKIPALFGYSIFLTHQNISSCKTGTLVIIISAISPLLAFISFFMAITFLKDASQTDKHRIAGILLVVSAGTFLYAVTMHILPEVYVRKNDSHSNEAGKTEAAKHFPKLFEMAVLFVGIFCPLSLKFF